MGFNSVFRGSGLYELAHRSLLILTISFCSSLSISLRHLPPCLSISLNLRLLISFCLHNFLIAAYALLSLSLPIPCYLYRCLFPAIFIAAYSLLSLSLPMPCYLYRCLCPAIFIAAYSLLSNQLFALKISYGSARGPGWLSRYSDSLGVEGPGTESR
jgi:hypothetical protein